MENITKTKNIQINSNLLVEIIKKAEEMESLVETLEISLDSDTLKQIEQSKKDFAQGKTKTVRDAKELNDYLSTLE